MNENRFAALRALLDCLMNESRSAELTQSLGSVSGPLPAILENILRRDDLPSLPESARLLLSMIPELYRMCASEQMGPHPQLNTLQKAGEYAHLQFVNLQYECICLMCLDKDFCLTECRMSGTGGLRDVRFYPRRLFQEAVSHGARAVILCHNHPSDWAFFSEDDISSTRELINLFSQANLPLLDHLLVAGGRVNSMRSRAFIPDAEWMRCGSGMPTLAQWRRDVRTLSQEHFINTTLNR